MVACGVAGQRADLDRQGPAVRGGERHEASREPQATLEATQGQIDGLLVNSHTNATRIRWQLWETDLRFAPGLPPGWNLACREGSQGGQAKAVLFRRDFVQTLHQMLYHAVASTSSLGGLVLA